MPNRFVAPCLLASALVAATIQAQPAARPGAAPAGQQNQRPAPTGDSLPETRPVERTPLPGGSPVPARGTVPARSRAAAEVVERRAAQVRTADASASQSRPDKEDRYAPWRAIDHLDGTAWCGPAGATLNVRWTGADDADRLEVRAGVWQLTADGKTRVTEAPAKIEVRLGGGPAQDLPLREHLGALTLQAPAKHVTLRLVQGPGCIDGVALQRQGERLAWRFGIDPAAAAAFPAALATLRDVLAACDAVRMAKLAVFPLRIEGRASTNAKQWAAQCLRNRGPALGAGIDPARDAAAATSLAPGALQFPLKGGDGVDWWTLVWRGGGWRLQGVE